MLNLAFAGDCDDRPTKQKRNNSLSLPHLAHPEQWHLVTAPRLGLGLDFSPSAATTHKGCLAPFLKSHEPWGTAQLPRWPSVPQDLPHATYLQMVFSFSWQASCNLPEAAPVVCAVHSWNSFGECSSMASVASENYVKAHPVLAWFLEAQEVVWEHGPLAQFLEGPGAAWEHTPFSHGHCSLWILCENGVWFQE